VLKLHHTTTTINIFQLKVKGGYIAVNGKPSQSYRALPAVWDHTVLPATQHRRTRPTLTHEKMEDWVDLGSWLHTKVVYLPAGSHPSKY